VFGEQEDHNSEPGDCAFVFGGSNPERVARAAELFRKGRTPLVLFSGGTRWGERARPEALVMRERALELGIPAENILVECESNHTKENVLASLLVLDRVLGLHKLRRLLVVSSPLHMRRCLLTMRTYMPGWIQYSWYPDDRKRCRADNWWKDAADKQRVLREARSLVNYVREGQLLDENLEL
jgi:hypothetical protein